MRSRLHIWAVILAALTAALSAVSIFLSSGAPALPVSIFVFSAAVCVLLFWQLAVSSMDMDESTARRVDKLDWMKVYILYVTLDKLLTPDQTNMERFSSVLNRIGIKFKTPYFQVLVVDICDIEEMSSLRQQALDDSMLEFTQPLSKPLYKHLGRYCQIYTLVRDEKMVCIINWLQAPGGVSDISECQAQEILQPELLKFAEEVRQQQRLRLRICMSRVFVGLENLDLAYSEATRLYDQSLFYPSDICLVTDENTESMSLSPEDRSQILNLDKQFVNLSFSHQYDDAFRKIDAMIEAASRSPSAASNLRSSIYNRLQWLISTSAADIPQETQEQIDLLLQKVRMGKNLSSLREYTREIFQMLSACSADGKSAPAINTNAIVEYIQSNSRDADMNVSAISYRFGVSVSYMSHMFKKEMNIGMLDYINQCRIADVKNVLETTNMNINSVAELTGFTNSWTMIRTFKRYEGITPSAYRSLYKDTQGGTNDA